MFDSYFVKIIRASDGVAIPIPNKYISIASYVSTPHQRQDLDSFQDDLGHLHRNTLEHTRSKLEWNTPPLTEREFLDLQNILNSAIINEKERKGKIIHYCFDTHTYEQGEFYIPDITFTPLRIYPNGEVLLDKVRLAFIEY
jgi:hypothetical protein